MHILLVEPDQLQAANYRLALERAGHSVAHGSNAQRALSAADDRKPDVVILELLLPLHNGVEFLYEFRSYPEWQDVPIVVLSLVPEDLIGGYAALFEQLGAVQYFYKPQTKLARLIQAVDLIKI